MVHDGGVSVEGGIQAHGILVGGILVDVEVCDLHILVPHV